MNATRNCNGGERTTLGEQIKAFFGATTDTSRRPDRRRARFQLEGLEQRRVMTTTATALGELVTQLEAATIAPAIAKQVVAGVQLVGLKNSSIVSSTVLSSSNVASALKQSGLGTVAVTQNLISDTSADVTKILQTELSSNPNLFAAPAKAAPASPSPASTATVLAQPNQANAQLTAALNSEVQKLTAARASTPAISPQPAVKPASTGIINISPVSLTKPSVPTTQTTSPLANPSAFANYSLSQTLFDNGSLTSDVDGNGGFDGTAPMVYSPVDSIVGTESPKVQSGVKGVTTSQLG